MKVAYDKKTLFFASRSPDFFLNLNKHEANNDSAKKE